MKIVIAGGTGFLGSPLAEMYAEDGHEVRVLTRSLMAGDTRHDPGTGVPGITRVGWSPDGRPGPWASTLDGAAAVVNLAGESIAAARWTPQRKAKIRDSRLLATRSLAHAITASANPPAVFISGSGVDYYGRGGDTPRTEESGPGTSWLAQLCQDWEAEARAVKRPETRVVVLRTGIVLERSGGALPKMMRPFKFFVGGRIGSGRQPMSWIHRLDWIEMVRWIVATREVAGAVNATAPHPVTNAQFSRSLGRWMRRPSLLPAPGFAVKLVAGELAGEILSGQRVVPAKALALGYHFRYPELDMAFRGIFGE